MSISIGTVGKVETLFLPMENIVDCSRTIFSFRKNIVKKIPQKVHRDEISIRVRIVTLSTNCTAILCFHRRLFPHNCQSIG